MTDWQTTLHIAMAALQSRTGLGFFRTTRVFLELKPTAGETCCICLEPYGPGHRAVRVHFRACMHTFGRSCLDSWLESGSPMSHCCPTCRKQWYTPSPNTDDIRRSLTARFMETLALLRSRVRRNQPAAAGAHSVTDSITGLPIGTTAREIMERISDDLAILEDMDFETLGNSLYVRQQLRNLQVRFELLRQNVEESQTSRRTSSQFNVLGLPPRPFDDLIGIGPVTNRFPVNFIRDRDSVGDLDRVQSQHSGHQRSPSLPRNEARTRSSTNTTIITTTTLRARSTTETSPPQYDEAVGTEESDDALVELQAYLDNYTVSDTPDETPSNAATAAGGSSTPNGARPDTRPNFAGISRNTRTRMARIPDISGVQNMSSLTHYSL